MIGALAGLAECGVLPDVAVRAGIRGLLRERLREERRLREREPGADAALREQMRRGPIAVAAQRANEQHYEVPPEFFRMVLGRHLKYSCGLWEPGTTGLDEAEAAMLALTCARAGLEEGMEVLDLGCGWGSLTLWIAERYPRCRVLAVSNSAAQRDFILAEARARGLRGIEVVTADVSRFDPGRRFHRVISVEMFEHVRNPEALLERVAGWLHPAGRLLVHIFCHRSLAYFFEDSGPGDWMARHFFTGGMMPSEDLLPHSGKQLELEERWRLNGEHYRRTSLAWLERLDARRGDALALFRRTAGEAEARRWVQRWRIFFMACAELFGYRGGEEWFVAHYRFRPALPAGGTARGRP